MSGVKERVNRYLELLKKDIENKQELLNRVEDSPLLFFSELVWRREGIIPMVLGEQGEQELLQYQNWLYPKVISALVEKYNITEYTLHYNETLFPSPIQLSRNDALLAEIHPYQHTFVIIMPARIPFIMNQLLTCIPEMLRLEQEINLSEVQAENPLLLGGANPVKLIKIGVNKKKTIATLKEQAIQQWEQLTACRQQYAKWEEELEKEQDAVFHEEDLLRIGKRLQEHYDFTTLDERMQAQGDFEMEKARIYAAFENEKQSRLFPEEG